MSIPFFSMVTLMVKWALAAIPAVIILTAVMSIVLGALSSLGT